MKQIDYTHNLLFCCAIFSGNHCKQNWWIKAFKKVVVKTWADLGKFCWLPQADTATRNLSDKIHHKRENICFDVKAVNIPINIISQKEAVCFLLC